MNKYELVIVLNSDMPQDEKDKVVKEAGEVVSKMGGKVINSQLWLDKQRFAFRIKKYNEGSYYIVNFESQSADTSKIRQELNLNEKILRFLVVKGN